MRWWTKACTIAALAGALWAAGPVDFGMGEVNAAIAVRNLKYKPKISAELDIQAPETYRIEPYAAGGGHVTGGDLRGLMYGLLEAADQIRSAGRLKLTHGAPALALRGVRIRAAAGASWFSSHEFWNAYFAGMARDRFNRLNIAFDSAPSDDVLPMLKMICQIAQQYGVDVAIGFGAPSLPAIESLLANCPTVRTISLRGESLPDTPELLRTLHDAGRRVVLELPDNQRMSALIESAGRAGEPLRLFAPLVAGDANPQPRDSYIELEPAQGVDAVAAISGAGFEVASPLDEGGRPTLEPISAWGRIGYSRPEK